MLFQVEENIKEIKKVSDTPLKVIDYVKALAINLNNYQEKYDKEQQWLKKIKKKNLKIFEKNS